MSDGSRPVTMGAPAAPRPLAERALGPTNAFESFPRGALERSIPDRFEEVVRRYPDRLAVKTATKAHTYARLDAAANRLAHTLLARHAMTEEPVAFLLERGDAPVIATLGILKAGKSYVALDPAFPHERLRDMLVDSAARCLVTNGRNAALAADLAAGQIEILDLGHLAPAPATSPGLLIAPDEIAYITYTSGSTGRPKGVYHDHRNLLHSVLELTNALHISREDRLTMVYSPGAATAAIHLFCTLLNGASVFPFDLEHNGVGKLAAWLRAEGITIHFSVASVFRLFARSLSGGEAFPELRIVYAGSEPVTARDVELYHRHFPAMCLFVANYGISEAGNVRRHYFTKDSPIPEGYIPAGYPVADKEVLLLDEQGNDATAQGEGEIAIRSPYLALGYWRRPDLTAAAFLPDPDGGDARIYRTGDLGRLWPDGCLEHLGRKDSQTKVRGLMVDLPTVEAELLGLGNIQEAAVVVREDQPGDQRVVAYLVPAGGSAPTAATLRRALANKLPDHMLPSTVVSLDLLPRTPTGKLDRRALPAPERARHELESPFVPPRTPEEERVAAIWAGVLGLDRVGVHDTFLELGGHSLLAAQIVSRVIEAFRVEVPLRLLFEAPTVAEMAAVLTPRQRQTPDAVGKEQLVAELENLSEGEAQRLLAAGMMAGDLREADP